MALMDDLLATPPLRVQKGEDFFQSAGIDTTVRVSARGVAESDEFKRIMALPRRPPPSSLEAERLAVTYKSRFGKGTVTCACATKYNRSCCSELLPVQALALREMEQTGGLVGAIGVGHGKTLLDLLAALAVPDVKVAVLLVPASLKHQLLAVDLGFYGQHWQLPNIAGSGWLRPGLPTLHIRSYSDLSSPKATVLLDQLGADLFILDEAHSLRARTASRTKRFLRYLAKREKEPDKPKVRTVAYSGTLMSKSIKDYAHFCHAALGDGSPVPNSYQELEMWAGALDVITGEGTRVGAGALEQLDEGAGVLAGFNKRFIETPGVVSTGDAGSCQASLIISEYKVEVPKLVEGMLETLELTAERPDGEQLVEADKVAQAARQLSCGFYFRWRWPRKEPVPVIERWLEVRKKWNKELREKLKHGREHTDSPHLLEAAASRWLDGYVYHEKGPDGSVVKSYKVPPKTKSGPMPAWASEHWEEWRAVEPTAKPESVAVWVDDFYVQRCAAWFDGKSGLLWYEFPEFAQRVVSASGAVFCGAGDEGSERLAQLSGKEQVVVSIRSHGQGKNLQVFNRSLVANPPSDGATWEQLLGRTHRGGQLADEVFYDVPRHTESVRKAVAKARALSYGIQGAVGNAQKLASKATWLF